MKKRKRNPEPISDIIGITCDGKRYAVEYKTKNSSGIEWFTKATLLKMLSVAEIKSFLKKGSILTLKRQKAKREEKQRVAPYKKVIGKRFTFDGYRVKIEKILYNEDGFSIVYVHGKDWGMDEISEDTLKKLL
ncbi:MAG: hypothetical protein Q8L34_04400 [Candidatus Woesearchaeota archaeon]|nr:hypothetical protein [Candidatus Woesearchaeota archaeon]